MDLDAAVTDVVREHGFSGVVRVDRGGEVVHASAHGLADRAHGLPNRLDTQFGTASVCKGLTALTVVSLVAEGRVGLETPVRAVVGDDLPDIGGDVTIEHLLSHRSGIGDYLDEDTDLDASDYVMTLPVHRFATTEGYLPALRGRPTKFAAGERFSYCNSGFVVLALVVERLTGTPFHEAVEERVCAPAGMVDTAYLRSDELPGRAALGYLDADGLRTNVLHLPVRGSGDGGMYTTVADLHALWDAFLGGHIVDPTWVAEMLRPRTDVMDDGRRYGLGVWLDGAGDGAVLNGYDAGVSAVTRHEPSRAVTWCVLANRSDVAWPVAQRLREVMAD
ncbi:serine hydrolase [Terracoccus sp. 273MFTsu3.1]|uniref:serine hydrolase domain-containing protein n=1 Tax=Terracoccus sp. 273MFTsu3.1 TaxID=1172188 RepID=UPI00037A198B|nr:serine hydrolase domain-containing protein [Terracoccus sp. 273MFTsu3.1]